MAESVYRSASHSCLAVGSDQERPLTAFPRLIRFAKIAALGSAILTVSYAILLLGWQTYTFLSEGDWPAVPVKFALNKLKNGHGVIYETARTRGIAGNQFTDASDALLQIPAIVPLLFAAVLLIVFYLWLSHIEKEYSEY